MSYIFNPLNNQLNDDNIGGKGINLLKLSDNFNVPSWFALTTEAFNHYLEFNELNAKIAELITEVTDENLARNTAVIRNLILKGKFDSKLKDQLNTNLTENDSFVSVRSSAADEDGESHSFAGIHESYLFVKGTESIIEHIKKVWASAYEERAIFYRRKNNLTTHPIPMAVIIQQMIDARSSGVVFTINPTNQNVEKVIISSLFGLGEGLVSAGLEADQFEVDKTTKEISSTFNLKQTAFQHDTKNGSGIVETDLPEDKQNAPSLTDSEIVKLTECACRIEKQYRKPQDIEFCYDKNNKLYILQSRNITTAEEYGPAAGNHQIWDNSNIIESYSGVTSPMTFSFIRQAYATVYNCFSEVMGIPHKTIQQNQTVYSNMLGLFHGQVYYNLPNWYKLVKQFPGYNYNKAFMESMMGVKEKADSNDTEQKQSKARKYFIELPKLLKLVFGMGRKFIGLKKSVPQFNNHFETHYSRWATMDFDKMPPNELMHVYEEMREKLLKNWHTPIINDFHVMVFYGTLKNCCKKWCNDENETLQNNLICGEGDIESTVPTRLLMKLASEIKQKSELIELFSDNSPEELLQIIPAGPQTQFIADAVQDYLDKYGFRCINELKLEEPSLHETPEFIYQMLKNYLKMDDSLLDISALHEREKKIRKEAEEQAFSNLSPIRKRLFSFILKQARNGVKNRENMRFARTKIYGQLRLILNSVGQHFTEEQIIDEPQDIYYLTVDEVWDFVKGTAVTVKLNELIQLRKKEFNEYREAEENPADHFSTYGMAYHRNQFKNYSAQKQEPLEPGMLKGVGCSPGKITGIAKVVNSPKDDTELNGEILIAGRTDPGWVPLYPSVSGILIERGSILSHSAIVAREMGIPAIVGIPNLMSTLQTGDQLEMDGNSGIVTQL